MIILMTPDEIGDVGFFSLVTQLLKKEHVEEAILVTLGGDSVAQSSPSQRVLFNKQVRIPLPLNKGKLSKFNQKEKETLGIRIIEYLVYEELIDDEVPCTIFLHGSQLNFLVEPIRNKLKARLGCFADYFHWEQSLNGERYSMLAAFDNISNAMGVKKLNEMTNSEEDVVFNSVDFIVTRTPQDSGFLQQAYRIAPSKIFDFPLWQNQIECEGNYDSQALKDKFNLKGLITLLFIAENTRLEELLVFLKILSQLAHHNFKIKVALYGTLDFPKLVSDTEPDLLGKIVFLGELDNVWLSKWIQVSDVVVSLPLARLHKLALLNLLNTHKKKLIITSYTIDPSNVPNCSIVNIPFIVEDNQYHICEKELFTVLSQVIGDNLNESLPPPYERS